MYRSLMLAAAFFLVVSPTIAQDDQQRILGVWIMAASQQKAPQAPGGDLMITFTADQFRYHMPAGAGRPQAYKIDPSKKPKAIDWADRPGIYEFDRDKLKVCLAAKGQPRPKEFDARATFVLRRETNVDGVLLKRELADLQGDWKIASLKTNGESEPNVEKNAKVTVAGSKMTLRGKEAKMELVFLAVAPTRSPKLVDVGIVQNGKLDFLGAAIYELNDDHLRICIGDDPWRPRPDKFVSEKSDRQALWVLRRERK
jgi:uncharacterized protein (TIGR03067 family)